jgi:uncharacterized protein YndB with AHSA1/START domain
MNIKADIEPTDEERQLKLTRVLAAPRHRVFALWIDQTLTAQWWGPRGFTNPLCEIDARPGGAIRIHMRAPDGTVHRMTGVFREVTAPERLAFTTSLNDAGGRRLLDGHISVALDEHAGITALALKVRAVGSGLIAARMLAGMEPGWSQSLERLAALASAPLTILPMSKES